MPAVQSRWYVHNILPILIFVCSSVNLTIIRQLMYRYYVIVPKQPNDNDCGVYVCRYILAIFRLCHMNFNNGICEITQHYNNSEQPAFTTLITDNEFFSFGDQDIQDTRKNIQALIRHLHPIYEKLWSAEKKRQTCYRVNTKHALKLEQKRMKMQSYRKNRTEEQKLIDHQKQKVYKTNMSHKQKEHKKKYDRQLYHSKKMAKHDMLAVDEKRLLQEANSASRSVTDTNSMNFQRKLRSHSMRELKATGSGFTPRQLYSKIYLRQQFSIRALPLAISWCKTEFLKLYTTLIVRIAPGTNAAKWSHQTPQPLRMFYSRFDLDSRWKNTSKRFLYGAKGVFSSTGIHPNNFKVRPFTAELEGLASLVQEATGILVTALEIKIYQGDQILMDKNTGIGLLDNLGNPLKLHSNSSTRKHTDTRVDKDGKQLSTDSVCIDQSIATFTVGSSRKLSFHHMTKLEFSDKWIETKPLGQQFDLEHGSLFVLSPQDETPKLFKGTYHKAKHSAKLMGQDISFAFIFRSVKEESWFDSTTHQWTWNKDPNYIQYIPGVITNIENSYVKTGAVSYIHGKLPLEIGGLFNNVADSVRQLEFR